MFYTFRTLNRKCGLFRTFGQGRPPWLSKLHSRVQKNLFQFISFFSKKNLFLNLCWFWAQVYHILRQTIFSRLVKTAILGAKRTFWGETVFWLDFFKVVLSFSKSFRTFGQAFWQVCQNWILKSTGMFLGKLCISWRNHIFLILEFCPEIFRTSGKSFLQGFKAAFYVSWENYSGEVFNFQKKNWKLFRFFSKNCGFAAAKFEHFGENRIPRVQKKTFRRGILFLFENFPIVLSFSQFEQKLTLLSDFRQILSAKLSKLHSNCPRDHMKTKIFLKKIVVYLSFGFFIEEFPTSG